MVVEPDSLCCPSSWIVVARDKAPWAKEFEQFSSLEAMARDWEKRSNMSAPVAATQIHPTSTTGSIVFTRSAQDGVHSEKPGVGLRVHYGAPIRPRRSSIGVTVRDFHVRVKARLCTCSGECLPARVSGPPSATDWGAQSERVRAVSGVRTARRNASAELRECSERGTKR